MRAVKRNGATGHFSWIGSDGWSARALVSEGMSKKLFWFVNSWLKGLIQQIGKVDRKPKAALSAVQKTSEKIDNFFGNFSGNEQEVEGTLSVQPQANVVKGFEDYFLSLTVQNNLRNPWFTGIWHFASLIHLLWEKIPSFRVLGGPLQMSIS